MKIPIQNIYYLLCYAWDKPEQKDNKYLDIESGAGLLELFTKLLINSTNNLLKKGLEQSYIRKVDEVPGIKGKLEIGATVKSNLLNRQKTICNFDEFSPDILSNQILFTTLKNMLKVTNLNKELKKKLVKIIFMFPETSYIKITPSVFKNLKFHRNNRHYEFIMNICRIISENLMPQDSEGNLKFIDFRLDDRKMNQIYESFLFNFLKREQNLYHVKRDNISWNLDQMEDGMKSFLPLMKTDITLQNHNKKIIIDAKFYRETLIENYGTKKIRSGHLYQLFSYLINQENMDERTISAKGILLYPTISEEYELSYRYKNHDILIKTINLNSEWQKIHNSILNIIK